MIRLVSQRHLRIFRQLFDKKIMAEEKDKADSGAGFDFSRHSAGFIESVLKDGQPFSAYVRSQNASTVQSQAMNNNTNNTLNDSRPIDPPARNATSSPHSNHQRVAHFADRSVESNRIPHEDPRVLYEARVINGVQCFVPITDRINTSFVNAGSSQFDDNQRQSSGTESRLNLGAFDRVSAWNLKFTGTQEDDVREFLDRVEVCRDACSMRDDELFKVIPVMLQDIAFIWWVERKDTFRGYHDFRDAFLKRFSNQEVRKCQVIRDIVTRTQGDSEKGTDYLDNVRRMWTDSADSHFSVEARLDIVYMNLRREYHEMIARREFRSFNELEDLVQDFDNRRNLPALRPPPLASETTYPACGYHPERYARRKSNSQSSVAHVYSVSDVSVLGPGNENRPRVTGPNSKQSAVKRFKGKESLESSTLAETETVPTDVVGGSTGVTEKRGKMCFNCRGYGHRRKHCPKPSAGIYCFTCGKPGVKVYSCPNCSKSVLAKLSAKSQGNENRGQ